MGKKDTFYEYLGIYLTEKSEIDLIVYANVVYNKGGIGNQSGLLTGGWPFP